MWSGCVDCVVWVLAVVPMVMVVVAMVMAVVYWSEYVLYCEWIYYFIRLFIYTTI